MENDRIDIIFEEEKTKSLSVFSYCFFRQHLIHSILFSIEIPWQKKRIHWIRLHRIILLSNDTKLIFLHIETPIRLRSVSDDPQQIL